MLLTAACQSDRCRISGEARHLDDGAMVYLITDLSTCRHADSAIVNQGHFALSVADGGDHAPLCQIVSAAHPEAGVTFFAVPGDVYVELRPAVGRSRVSGSKVNNQWQALNDSVALCDRRLRPLIRAIGKADSLDSRRLYRDIRRLHTRLNDCISDAARRNRDNAMGHYIATHYTAR